jgi:hypothetical protein
MQATGSAATPRPPGQSHRAAGEPVVERRNRQCRLGSVTIGQQQHAQAAGPRRPGDLQPLDRRAGGALAGVIFTAGQFGNRSAVSGCPTMQLVRRAARERTRRRGAAQSGHPLVRGFGRRTGRCRYASGRATQPVAPARRWYGSPRPRRCRCGIDFVLDHHLSPDQCSAAPNRACRLVVGRG